MSRITANSKTFVGVRVLPPISPPSQTGVQDSNLDDFPPPPPSLSAEDYQVRVVLPSQVQKDKPGQKILPVKVLPTTGKWKKPMASSVRETQEQLISQGLRMPNTDQLPPDEANPIQADVHNNTPSELGTYLIERRSASPKPMLGNPELPDNVGALLMESCLTASWTSVENILKLLEKAFRVPEKKEQVIIAINISDEVNFLTPLMVCARESRMVPVEELVKLGADVNAKTKDGETALHYAVREGKEDMVRLLVQLGADVTVQGGVLNQLPLHLAAVRKFGAWPIVQFLIPLIGPEGKLTPDRDGYIPLWRAAEHGNLHVIRELLLEHAHQQLSYQNPQFHGDTLAHHMVRRKDTEVLKILIEHDAPIDVQNAEGETLLHIATHIGSIDSVNLLYEKRANPDILDQLGRSPLYLAVEKGITNVVDTLIDRFRGSIKTRALDGSTLAHIAAEAGHASTVDLLLRRGVPINMPNKAGNIALHVAAKNGHAEVVNILLAKGSSVDAPTKDHYTSLHLAVENGHPNVVEVLLGHGAAVDAIGGEDEETALHIAARAPRGDESAEMLIKSGANATIKTKEGETPLHRAVAAGTMKLTYILLSEGADIAATNNAGEGPLHISVRGCHYQVSRELLEHISRTKGQSAAMAVVNAQDDAGETSVHHVAQIQPELCHFPQEDVMLTQLLLDYDGDTDIPTKDELETPLHYCAKYGNYEILDTVIKHLGPEKLLIGLSKLSKVGWTPLLTACQEGHVDIVRLLLEHNARVDVFDEDGRAALHLAAENNHLEVVDLLLKHRAFVNAKNKDGVTPAHLAAERGAADIVELLVEKYQANADVLSLSKKTPLHLAAQAGQWTICERLLRLGADPLAKDARGQTPMHLAATKNHAKIVQLFLENLKDTDPTTVVDLKGLNIAHTAAKTGGMEVLQLLLNFHKEMVISSKVKSTESTSLHLSAAGGFDEIVAFLVSEGASATEENKEGLTPLHVAARFGHIKVLECLRDSVSLNVYSIKTGLSPLHLACFTGQVEFARELLVTVPVTLVSLQPTSNTPMVKHIGGEAGLTALHLAAHSGQENIVRLLLNYPGIQAEAAAEVTGFTPLHMAAMNGRLPVMALLLSKIGTNINVEDRKGRSALMLACSKGHTEMATLLIGQGGDLSQTDQNGWTPLHHACFAGHQKVVKTLVEAGASTETKNKEGKIPLCLAAGAMKASVTSYLITKPHDVFELLLDNTFVFDLMMCSKSAQNKPLQEFIVSSPSPVEVALKLARFYLGYADVEKERERDLTLASKFCDTLANDLLTISCNKFNPAVILRATDNYDKSLMDILVEGEHKEVVSLPAVQRYLTEVWHGNQEWSDGRSFMIFFGFLLCPPLWLFFCLPTGHKYNYIPFVKLICLIVSHIFFIIMLILVFMAPFEKLYERMSPTPSPQEVLLILWIVGKVVEEFTTAEERSGLGFIRVVVIGLCLVGFVLHIVAFCLDRKAEIDLLYIRNQIFALACFFACIQIISYLSFHYMFGPFAIIIRDVVKDLLRFLVILILFLVGFTFCLSSLYEDIFQPPASNKYENAVILDMLVDPFESFKMLYFALFGLINPPDLPKVKYGPIFAQTLITMMYMVYLMVTMVVLINLLIAMLSDTYQRIQARSDLEWKYGRAKLVMNMDKAAITPPPLNTFTVFIISMIDLCNRTLKKQSNSSDSELDNVSKSSSRRGSRVASWRRSFQSNPESGASQLFRDIPVQKLTACIDWKAVVAGYISNGLEEEELLQLEIENEVEQ